MLGSATALSARNDYDDCLCMWSPIEWLRDGAVNRTFVKNDKLPMILVIITFFVVFEVINLTINAIFSVYIHCIYHALFSVKSSDT